tara:strand:+ start:1215 stop:2357 length:1143 start_codon:yes stop_codon:yes gene_type:complete
MEIKVKAVGDSAEKSTQQKEQELLDKHEQSLEQKETTSETPVVKEVKEETPVEPKAQEEKVEEEKPVLEKADLTEEEVLSHINKRYNKNIDSVDDLFASRETQEELPEDVAAYLKYKKDTGRGIEDYVKLNQNFDDMDPDNLLRKYFKETEEGLDDEDIAFKMEEFDGDEELDEPSDIKRKKIAKKKVIAKAKKYFTELKEKYNKPLESSGNEVSQSDSKEYQEYKQYLKDAKTYEEETTKKRNWFDKKTNEVFSSEFKGFEFTLDDKRVIFSPGNASELKSAQSTPMNFVKKYLDESGLIKDAKGYHRALAIAMNPDRFAQFFYEQGKSNATEDVMRKTKNINMSERRVPESTQKGGMQFKSLSQASSRGLKIKSIKKK